MFTKLNRSEARMRRTSRIRSRVTGTSQRPRLAVHRSLTRITVQLIDDTAGVTLASASDVGLTGAPLARATTVGQQIAERAKTKNINTVVFDRGGFLYHGRVAALAQGARDSGLQF